MVVHTPGHTPGGISLLAGRHVLTGDTLFPGGPGLTGWPLSDFATIIDSIRDGLFALPDDTVVLPGHGRSTTIGTERPHLDDWIARNW
jgi:glyoxylase-like metal-dependent hydrolase (beta-lactamase superfamily II)